jgi:hypothetical protein
LKPNLREKREETKKNMKEMHWKRIKVTKNI